MNFNTLSNLLLSGDERLYFKSHKKQISIITKLSKFIPKKYSDYDIPHIIMARTYSTVTPLDDILTKYYRLSDRLNKFIHKHSFSSLISYNLLRFRESIDSKKYINYKEEMPINTKNIFSSPTTNIDQNKSYNLLFANLEQYLRPLVVYMRKSNIDNHILVIPKHLKNLRILKKLDSNKIFFYEDFVTPEIMDEYNRSKKDFASVFNSRKDELSDLFRIEGRDFFTILESGLANVFKHVIPQAILFYLINEEIFKRIKIKSVIGVRMRRIYDRAFHVCARNHNIGSYILPHSFLPKKRLHTIGHFRYIKGVFAWSESQKKTIINDSFSNVPNIYVTGSPLFFKTKNNNINKTEKTILYAAALPDFEEVELLSRTINLLDYKAKLIVKTQPGHDHRAYEKYNSNGEFEIIKGDTPVEDYISEIDLFITISSGSSLTAMLHDKPTVHLLVSNNKFHNRVLREIYLMNIEEEKSLIIKSKKDIKKIINNLLTSEIYRKNHLKMQNKFLGKRIKLFLDPQGSSRMIDNLLIENSYDSEGDLN